MGTIASNEVPMISTCGMEVNKLKHDVIIIPPPIPNKPDNQPATIPTNR